jgi:uncharacterized coiled-coil protein SlyX
VNQTTLTVNDKILELETEIASRNADIQNLSEALATLEAGNPRPVDLKQIVLSSF